MGGGLWKGGECTHEGATLWTAKEAREAMPRRRHSNLSHLGAVKHGAKARVVLAVPCTHLFTQAAASHTGGLQDRIRPQVPLKQSQLLHFCSPKAPGVSGSRHARHRSP